MKPETKSDFEKLTLGAKWVRGDTPLASLHSRLADAEASGLTQAANAIRAEIARAV